VLRISYSECIPKGFHWISICDFVDYKYTHNKRIINNVYVIILKYIIIIIMLYLYMRMWIPDGQVTLLNIVTSYKLY